jgi:CubicO group peptidase (beta-lactamase class C family)
MVEKLASGWRRHIQVTAQVVTAIVRKGMKTYHLRAVIVRVTKGDKVVTTQAFGPSMTGEPATPAMHFRNGAIAFAYVATLLMEYVDEHKVKLNDTINRWVPSLPEANKVTLKMLANQTTGYPDFETPGASLVQLRTGSGPAYPAHSHVL